MASYKCTVCDETFEWRRMRRLHEREVHPRAPVVVTSDLEDTLEEEVPQEISRGVQTSGFPGFGSSFEALPGGLTFWELARAVEENPHRSVEQILFQLVSVEGRLVLETAEIAFVAALVRMAVVAQIRFLECCQQRLFNLPFYAGTAQTNYDPFVAYVEEQASRRMPSNLLPESEIGAAAVSEGGRDPRPSPGVRRVNVRRLKRKRT